MNRANHRAQVSDLLDEWTNNPKQAKNIINCLVEFLTGDLYWLNENISRVDRQTLVAAAKRLEHSEAPNVEFSGVPVGHSINHPAGGTSAGTQGYASGGEE